MAFSWIFRLGKASADYYILPKKIEKLNGEIAKPISSYFYGADRYYAIADIKKMELYNALRFANRDKKNTIINEYLTDSKEILMSYEDELTEIPATRFDVECLTAAINEIALLLDENIKTFDDNSKDLLNQFVKQGNAILENHKRKIESLEEAINNRISKTSRGLEEHREETKLIEKKIIRQINNTERDIENRTTGYYKKKSLVWKILIIILVIFNIYLLAKQVLMF